MEDYAERDELLRLAGRLVFPVLVLLYAFAYFSSISGLPRLASGFPMVVLTGLVIVCLIQVGLEFKRWHSVRGGQRAEETVASAERAVSAAAGGDSDHGAVASRSGSDYSFEGFRAHGWHRTVAMVVLTAGLVVGMTRLGFYTSILLYLAAGFLVLGVRRPRDVVLLVGGLVLTIWLLFDRFLQLQLPFGGLLP